MRSVAGRSALKRSRVFLEGNSDDKRVIIGRHACRYLGGRGPGQQTSSQAEANRFHRSPRVIRNFSGAVNDNDKLVVVDASQFQPNVEINRVRRHVDGPIQPRGVDERRMVAGSGDETATSLASWRNAHEHRCFRVRCKANDCLVWSCQVVVECIEKARVGPSSARVAKERIELRRIDGSGGGPHSRDFKRVNLRNQKVTFVVDISLDIERT